MPTHGPLPVDDAEGPSGRAPARGDALQSRERILRAAALIGDRRVSMEQLAAAANVARSTLYRHFPNR